MAGHSKWSRLSGSKGANRHETRRALRQTPAKSPSLGENGQSDPGKRAAPQRGFRPCPKHAERPTSERAIKRGTGEGMEARHFSEIVYEGYAPGGVAVIVEKRPTTRTGRRRKSAASLPGTAATSPAAGAFPACFTKRGGSRCRGVPRRRADFPSWPGGWRAGVDNGGGTVCYHFHDQLYAVSGRLKNAGNRHRWAKFTFIPDTTVPVHDEAVALQILRLCDSLEEDETSKTSIQLRYSRRITGKIAGVKKPLV